jgi:transcriptional regulator with XRE-family HTH domain
MRVHRFSGEALRVRRQAAGLRREAIAIHLGRSAETIGLWERDSVSPSARQVADLAQLLGCAPGDLFAEVDQ